MNKMEVKMNKPVYLGLSICLNKTKIWRQDKTKLMDMDSFIFQEKLEDVYLDLSEYSKQNLTYRTIKLRDHYPWAKVKSNMTNERQVGSKNNEHNCSPKTQDAQLPYK